MSLELYFTPKRYYFKMDMQWFLSSFRVQPLKTPWWSKIMGFSCPKRDEKHPRAFPHESSLPRIYALYKFSNVLYQLSTGELKWLYGPETFWGLSPRDGPLDLNNFVSGGLNELKNRVSISPGTLISGIKKTVSKWGEAVLVELRFSCIAF